MARGRVMRREGLMAYLAAPDELSRPCAKSRDGVQGNMSSVILFPAGFVKGGPERIGRAGRPGSGLSEFSCGRWSSPPP